VLVVVLAVALLAGLVTWLARSRSLTRRIDAPAVKADATFTGDVMSRPLITSGALARLEILDWGVRIRGMFISRWVVPTWEARFTELAIAELVAMPHSRTAVWFRLRGEASGIGFMASPAFREELLRMLEKHEVPINRSVAQIRRVDEMYAAPR
jgi:hypothetical protein